MPRKKWLDDPLAPVEGSRVRAVFQLLELSNREAAAVLKRQGVRVAAQTLDYLTSQPQQQRRARESLIRGIARLPQTFRRPAVPEYWLRGRRRLIQGTRRPPLDELVTWSIGEELMITLKAWGRRPALAGTVVSALTSAEHWYGQLVADGSPPLTEAAAGSATTHLAEAFRILLAPIRAGKAHLNRQAIQGLANLWNLQAGSSIPVSGGLPLKKR
jgi:hypothetical protein